jgi:serine/threonine protein kinase
MSPEQTTCDVSQLDGRSDIFSLGVVFYEMLVGERPFHGKCLVDLVREIRSGTPKSPDRLGVPKKLSEICMKCLAKRPADRFQTGKQLADELDRWLTLWEGDAATPDASRNNFGVAMALVALVLALALTWFRSTLQGGGGSGSKSGDNATPQTTRP